MGGLGTLLGTYHFQRISVPEAVASFLSFPWLRNTSISVCVCVAVGAGEGNGAWSGEWHFPGKVWEVGLPPESGLSWEAPGP